MEPKEQSKHDPSYRINPCTYSQWLLSLPPISERTEIAMLQIGPLSVYATSSIDPLAEKST